MIFYKPLPDLFRAEDILLQPPERFLHPCSRQSEVETDGIGLAERRAVLPDHADRNSGAQQLIQTFPMLLKPFMAVKIQHVGSLRLRYADSLKVLCNVIASPGYIPGKYLSQLVHPRFSRRFIGADQRMHGENIHMVIAGEPGLLLHAVTQILAVNNMV